MAEERNDLAALNAARRALGGEGQDGPAPGIRPLQRQADDFANRGDWGLEAEDLNRRLLELDPVRKVAMTRLAKCLRERGDAEAAETLYGEILTVDPSNVIASNFLRGVRLQRERAIAEEAEAALAAKKAAAAAKKEALAAKKAAAPAKKSRVNRNVAALAVAAPGLNGSPNGYGSLNGEAALSNGEAALSDGEAALSDGEAALSDGEAALSDGESDAAQQG
jgi:tetratricopeptide (TPR) repeat protein